jgi:hypothetical protein
MEKLVPHVSVGGNFIDGAIQLKAPVVRGLDETREWTRGGTFSITAGASYLLTSRLRKNGEFRRVLQLVLCRMKGGKLLSCP